MIDIVNTSKEVLSNAGYRTGSARLERRDLLLFENSTVLGFIFAYSSTEALLENWSRDLASAIERYKLGLRRAGHKAWNTYAVFLSASGTGESGSVALSEIEENLSATRKIARSNIRGIEDLRLALLPLLALQNPPRLEAVDMKSEIRSRTPELPVQTVTAFLSDAEPSTVLQIMESAP